MKLCNCNQLSNQESNTRHHHTTKFRTISKGCCSKYPNKSTFHLLYSTLYTWKSHEVCSHIPSLVPRPRGRREKWPGIHCLRMRERFRKSSAKESDYGQVTRGCYARNNQTRYTACSVAAVFTRRWLPLSETQRVTRQGLRYNHRRFHHHCACS